MIKIKTSKSLIEQIKNQHFHAVLSRIRDKDELYQKEVYNAVTVLPGIISGTKMNFEQMIEKDDWTWLEAFILADLNMIRYWVENSADSLKFTHFKDMYKLFFCNGVTNFVDVEKTYNAYTYLKAMDITVCPYCENEYLDILKEKDEKETRTSEIDHFYPKKDYAGLAMCFYNLVPSGQICNGIKKKQLLGMNPYDEEIERATKIYPDLPIGVNIETMQPSDCRLGFHAKGDMKKNVDVLLLEQRYERYNEEAYDLLRKTQQYSMEKIDEMVRFGFFESIEAGVEELFGPLDEKRRRHMLRQKMKKDLIGI